jgi:2'-5' RNA ligase
MSPAVNKQYSFSLWLRPNQAEMDTLMKVISDLSHRFNSTPFAPHITLLSGISADISTISNVCKNITDQYTVFDISLKKIAYTESYYRNLYITTKLEQPLIKLYEEASKQINNKMHDIFLPHVSLFYGKLNETKQIALKAQLDECLPKFFTCQRIDLYCTSSRESEWYLVDSFKLKFPPQG